MWGYGSSYDRPNPWFVWPIFVPFLPAIMVAAAVSDNASGWFAAFAAGVTTYLVLGGLMAVLVLRTRRHRPPEQSELSEQSE